MYYHWGATLAGAGFGGERDRFGDAANAWETASSPDSPWHTHFSTASPNHPDMRAIFDPDDRSYGYAVLEQPDGNHHFPGSSELWLRQNLETVPCVNRAREQGICTWYTGTGTPGPWQLDAQSVWMEELGHLQNLTHYDSHYNLPAASGPPGHETHAHEHTMSGVTVPGEIDKRTLLVEDRQRACEMYPRAHNGVFTC